MPGIGGFPPGVPRAGPAAPELEKLKAPCLCPVVRPQRLLPAGVGERGEGYQQGVLGEVFSEIDGDTMSSFQIPSAKARWPCSVKCTPSYARSTPHAPPYQSGQMDIHSRSISKRGSASLRRTLFLVMGVILQCAPMNEPVYQFMDKLAALYQVPVEELLDEYNLFLYKGQARQIIALRGKLGLSRTAFARQFGISERSLRAWESGEKVISKRCWERYFQRLMGIL